MPRSRTLTAALVVAPVVALGACGGVSKEDYAQDLDEICTDIEEKTEEIGQAQPDNPGELSNQLDEIRQAVRDGIERMKDVERPDGDDGEKAEEYVSKLETTLNEQVLPALDEFEAAIAARDQRRIQAAATKLQAIDEEETRQLAEDLGADECAEG